MPRFQFKVALGLVYLLTCMTFRVEGWSKDGFLRGQGQLQLSENKGRNESRLLAATLQSPFIQQTER